MIVPMKKIAIIAQAKDIHSCLKELAALGVLHIEHQHAPAGKDIIALHDDLASLKQAIAILRQTEIQKESPEQEAHQPADWRFITKHVVDLKKRQEQLEDYQRLLLGQISQWKEWGNFDPRAILSLREAGLAFKLYQIPAKELRNIPAGLIVEKLGAGKGLVDCAIISRKPFDLPFKELTLPKSSLGMMQEKLAEDRAVIERIQYDLMKFAFYERRLQQAAKVLEKELEFQSALAGKGQAGELAYLCGYAPFDRAQGLAEAAKKEGWAILISEPSAEDKVPTLIRNPRWVSIIKPLFRLIDVVPGYRELDISLWFLIFLSVFFGMLIGDAGYGLVFLLLTFFARRKWGRKLEDKGVFFLFYLFSSCAIIWGLLSATFFGRAWLPAAVKPLAPALRSDKNIQALCFFLGALHLSIGHAWRAILKLPSLAALADIGWLLILWAAFFLARALILGAVFPEAAKWIIIGGVILILFFSRPAKNPLKAISFGAGQLLLNLVNTFTDVVSYIRLFAVGLATVAVADAFNAMAMTVGFSNILTGIAASLILFLGHSLNVLLGPMAVLVHGVRLNVLEFCNHVDVKWRGFSYKPLQIERN